MSTYKNNQSSGGNSSPSPLVSEFASDAEMVELIEYFLNELQTGTNALQRAWEAHDETQLRKLAHQLKGAAGGYGFPSITEAAGDLESTLGTEQIEASAITEKMEALLQLCRRAAASIES